MNGGPTISIDSMAHGGDGVGRRDGKAVFVMGAIPGDRVTVDVSEVHDRFDKGAVSGIVDRSPDRVTPVCPHFSDCGGCQWQMATYGAQLDWKRETVRSQLVHIGGLEVDVTATVAPGPPVSYRNRMDFRLVDGLPALNRARSHDPVAISECVLLVPHLAILLEELEPLQGEHLTLRHGVNTGETVAFVDDEKPILHEAVFGHRFQITGRSFFQVNTAGAEHLVARVGALLEVRPDETLVDAYAGGGLFAAAVGAYAGEVVAIESNPTAVEDLKVNVPSARIFDRKVHKALREIDSVDLIVVDPPRQGLGAKVIERLVELRPRAIAYVSCDPASFARDARQLVGAGYELDPVEPVDMFPQTYHTELIARFRLR
jgi:tRNA/tmRNA/rRNA uracil-C5-methylase (TrmA/RlmC/RlmD family)